MRLYILSPFLFCLFSTSSISQVPIKGDTIRLGMFYTSRVEIESEIAFPFCGNIFKFNQECDRPNPGENCCSYSANLKWNDLVATSGLVNCPQGASLSWDYTSTLENARLNFESIAKQWESQQKTFRKEKITCIIFDKESEGYLIEQEAFQGYKYYILLAYSTYNGFNFITQYRSNSEIRTNDDIYPFFRQILRLK